MGKVFIIVAHQKWATIMKSVVSVCVCVCVSVCLCVCLSVCSLGSTVFDAGSSFSVYILLMIPSRSLLKMVEIGQRVRPLEVKVHSTTFTII